MPEQAAVAPQPAVTPRRYEIPVFADATPDSVAPAVKPEVAPAEAVKPAAAPTDGQNTGDQAPPTTPEGDKPDTDQEPERKRGTRRLERRLDKAYRERAEALARADLLAKQVEELKPKAPVDEAAPTLDKFNDIEAYADAKAKYESAKALREHEGKQRAQAHQQMQERISGEWEEKEAKGEDKYEDFNLKVGKLDPRVPMNIAMMQAENGEEIAYWLGSNLKEAERIVRLDPVAKIREIGRLEAKLLAEPPKPKTPSKAPAPITPLTGAAPLASDIPSEQDDMGAWMKKRQRQVHGKR